MTDPTRATPRPKPAERATYVKPELRDYGSVATITAAIGDKSTPDGGVPPAPNMASPS